MSAFEVAAIVIVLAAGFGYLNHRFIGLPTSSGLTLMGALAALAVVLIDRLTPGNDLADALQRFLDRVDFHRTLMDGMLSFLLFAGALHVDLGGLRRSFGPIVALSSIGVVASTALVAGGLWAIGRLFGLDAPFAWCLVFGALISPTDPVAVLGILAANKVSPALEATVGGESLFNDGVGVVLFSILLTAAMGPTPVSALSGAWMFVREAGGGVALGLALGSLAFLMMRRVDDYGLEILISLAVVMGGYALGHRVGVSGPVAMATAGLLIGNHGTAQAMSKKTRDYLVKFWEVVDEILNAALFLLIGLEAVALTKQPSVVAVALLVIPLALVARAVSVAPVLAVWRKSLPFRTGLAVLTWGGLRGGISVALALALPAMPSRDFLLVSAYLVVMFCVVVQGPTLGLLLRRLNRRPDG